MSKAKEIIEKIHNYSLEEIMGDRFGRYSKYIIQDRALPDVRDGLKPVQRRILYSMYKDGNTFDKETKKSAKAVGLIMGNYHPHGDTSIYDAMVRLSQKWKQRELLVIMQGNNGSIDGDPAAAMRYTEAKLSKLSDIILEDIKKECVEFAPTYDDVLLEPTVLPAHFPNLLVNGASGISAGYATNIPTHNIGEVIEATIKRIDNPTCRLETIMEMIQGPDFPTGGILEGKEGLISAYKTGKGKVVLRSKYEFIKEKSKEQIVISEIPYDTLRCNIIRRIEEIRLDKKIDGISEVRDESDKTDDLKIVIDIKKGANKDLIINYLLKNTDLQVNYNFNMVAIVNRRPKTLGILEMLDAFILHKREVVLKRSEFDLKTAQRELHILEGFIRALDMLDEIIKTIRKSKNKSDAINNLVLEYKFTKVQAEAIVMMQLYKLTNTDVTELKAKYEELKLLIAELKEIISSEEKLKIVMKNELKAIKKEFDNPRRTVIKDSVTEIVIDELSMVSKDDFVVCISKSGYIKKISIKSYNSSNDEIPGVKEGDYVENLYKLNNLDTIIAFTNLGNYLFLPVREIPEFKYKDIGTHVSNLVSTSDGERIIRSIAVNSFDDSYITAFTKNGMIKRTCIKSFEVSRFTKPINMFKLKDDDELVNISRLNSEETLIATKNGYALRFNTEEIPVVGLKTSGVKGIKLTPGDEVVNACIINNEKEHVTLFTDKGTAKRIKLDEITKTSRAKKGSLIIKSPKSKEYKVLNVFNSSSKANFGIITDTIKILKASDINIMEKPSIGSSITKKTLEEVFEVSKLKVISKETETKEITVEEEFEEKDNTKKSKQESNKEKVLENLTMSDFFDEFKI